MELSQLEVFLAVAREHRFSRAAEKLYRTQSAVSQTIRKLEDELGENLFDRSSREGVLTDAGQVLYEYAEKLLNLRQNAHESLAELRELFAREIRPKLPRRQGRSGLSWRAGSPLTPATCDAG